MNAPRRPASRSIIRLAPLGAAMAMASCGAHKAPTFRVTRAELGPQSPEAAIILVTIEGENPNPDPLPLYEMTYRATVSGHPQTPTVDRSPERTIPRFGRTTFRVPVVVPPGQLAGPAATVRLDGAVVYQLPGTIAQVFFDNDIRRPSVHVSGEQSVLLDATVPAP